MKQSTAPRELTVRGIILGAIITVVFTASNIYLGLRIGLTVASSIPAAVISMAALRALGGGGILENNMVQSQASAGGTLSTVFAVFPALILVGEWNHFPYLETAALSAAGGITGVLFTIPLRLALVTQSSLPYPEGVAAAEILKAGNEDSGQTSNSKSLALLGGGAGIAALFSFASGGLRLIADSASVTFSAGPAVFRLATGFSLALLGAGYLVGIAGGLAMLAGFVLSWLVAVPWLCAITPNSAHLAPDAFATAIWMHKVRFIGVGSIAIASLWTLGELAVPVLSGIRSALAGSAGLSSHDKDISPRTIMIAVVICAVLVAALSAQFLAPHTTAVLVPALAGTLFLFAFGFISAATCGYMAGLVGTSSSPISGVVLIATVLISSLFLGLQSLGWLAPEFAANHHHLAISFSIFILSAIVASAGISNDNLQDLKTGQLVGASPWKQEVALIIGCVSGALIIPPVLNLLYQAYGFAGALPRPGMDPAHALSAPQPAIISTVTSGIFEHNLDWSMITLGLGLGVILIAINAGLKRKDLTLPPLAVGIGLYLPPSISTTLALGAFVGWLITRRTSSAGSDSNAGTMLASGLIVGESLMGVALAAVSGFTGSDKALAFVGGLAAPWDGLAGAVCFVGCCVWFYRTVCGVERRATTSR